MQITEINCETGETTEREGSPEEQAKYEAELALMAENEAQLEAARVARESAMEKFRTMGLTEAEVKAILG
jgi:hypothetical protein